MDLGKSMPRCPFANVPVPTAHFAQLGNPFFNLHSLPTASAPLVSAILRRTLWVTLSTSTCQMLGIHLTRARLLVPSSP